MKTDLRNLPLEEMELLIQDMDQPRFRAKQVFRWIYKGKTDFREMRNLPEVFQQKLSDICRIGTMEVVQVQRSKTDGTRKYLFRLEDGNLIESVFMKYKYGNSICVSSQAGCRMGCKFCASSKKGLSRNLTAGEIVTQLLETEKDTGEKINHVVIMGTGEPFDNYDNVSKFIRIANDSEGLNLGMRNFTVSTCGLLPGIKKIAEDFPQINLAISLHGTTDEIRSSMMPINEKYPIENLLQAAKEYVDETHRRITFEYTLVNGVNDRDEDLKRLKGMLKGMLCHVNLIPLNKVAESGFDTVSRARALDFQKELEKSGIAATVRRELGGDIDAACGQLRLGKE